MCLCRNQQLLEVEVATSLSFSPWPLNNYHQIIFSVQNVRFFLAYNIWLLGTKRHTLYLFQISINNGCQLLLLWDIQKWNDKNPPASLNPQHFWFFFVPRIQFNKNYVRTAKLGKATKAKYRASDLWFLTHGKMGL